MRRVYLVLVLIFLKFCMSFSQDFSRRSKSYGDLRDPLLVQALDQAGKDMGGAARAQDDHVGGLLTGVASRSTLFLGQMTDDRYDSEVDAVVVSAPSVDVRRDDAIPNGELWPCWRRSLSWCSSRVMPKVRVGCAVALPVGLTGLLSSTRAHHPVEPTVVAVLAGWTIHRIVKAAKTRGALLRNEFFLIMLGVVGFIFDYTFSLYEAPIESNMITIFWSAALIQIIAYLLRTDDIMRFDPEAGQWRLEQQITELERRVALAESRAT